MTQGMNLPEIRGLENFEVAHFPRAEPFWSVRGGEGYTLGELHGDLVLFGHKL